MFLSVGKYRVSPHKLDKYVWFSVYEDQLSNDRGKLIESLTNKVCLIKFLSHYLIYIGYLPLNIARISYFSLIIVAISLPPPFLLWNIMAVSNLKQSSLDGGTMRCSKLPENYSKYHKCCHVVKQTGLLTKYKNNSLIWENHRCP